MRRKPLLAAISALLLVITIFSLLAFSATAEGELNYAYPRATKNEVVYIDKLLESLPGVSVGETERDYLRRHSDFQLTYNYGIPTSYVATDYDSNSGTLTVKATEYVYLAHIRMPKDHRIFRGRP